MDIKLLPTFQSEISIPTTIIKGFNYCFGKNTDNLEMDEVSEESYTGDYKSIAYQAVTMIDEDDTVRLAINPQESLTDKNYKFIYLLFDDLISGVTQFPGIVLNSADTLSQNKNLIIISGLTLLNQIYLYDEDYLLHLESSLVDKIPAANNINLTKSFLGKSSTVNYLLSYSLYNERFMNNKNINNNGLKLN